MTDTTESLRAVLEELDATLDNDVARLLEDNHPVDTRMGTIRRYRSALDAALERLGAAERERDECLNAIGDAWDTLVAADEIYYERKAKDRLNEILNQPWAALAREEKQGE